MQEETLGAVKGKLSYGHAIFFFLIPYVAAQPLKPVLSMPVWWAALG